VAGLQTDEQIEQEEHMKRNSKPTFADATRAIYIDFEGLGTTNALPVLLGSHWVDDAGDSRLVQYVFDSRLQGAARAKSAEKGGDCVYVASLDAAIAVICEIARAEDRLIVEWSKHEEQVVSNAMPDTLLESAFLAKVRDAKDVAKPWKRDLHHSVVFHPNDRGQVNCLSNFMALAGKPYPKYLKGAAGPLRHVLDQIDRRGQYKRVTKEAKRDWSHLLAHNALDCEGTRLVLMTACAEIESSGTSVIPSRIGYIPLRGIGTEFWQKKSPDCSGEFIHYSLGAPF